MTNRVFRQLSLPDIGKQLESYTNGTNAVKLNLRGTLTYQMELGAGAFGNITRINNALADLPKKLETAKAQLDNLLTQQEAAKQELDKPFAQAEELAAKEARLALLNTELNIEGRGGMDVVNDEDRREECGDTVILYAPQAMVHAKSERPSILDSLRSFEAGKPPAVPGSQQRKPAALDI